MSAEWLSLTLLFEVRFDKVYMLFLLSFFQSYLICGANLLRLVIWSLWFYVSFWFCTWHYIDLRSPFFWFCYIMVGNIFIKFYSLRRYRAVNCMDWFFFYFYELSVLDNNFFNVLNSMVQEGVLQYIIPFNHIDLFCFLPNSFFQSTIILRIWCFGG